MKKRFTILIAAVMLLVFMMPSMVGWGQTRETAGFSLSEGGTVPVAANANPATGTISGTNSTWTVTINGTFNSSSFQGTNGNRYWQMGKSSNSITSAVFSTNDISGTITSIVVRCASAGGQGGSLSATVGGNNFGTQNQTMPAWSNNDGGDVTFNGNASGAIVITEVPASGKACYIQSITVTYTSGGGITVATPTFDPAEGTYTSAQNVTISCTTQGATIYYTTDGSIPDDNSTEYTAAIPVSTTTTIKAIAYVDNDASNVASSTYTILTPLTTMQDIYDANSTSTDQNVAITFANWIITGSYSSYAFLSDGDNGLLIFGSGHGFVQGDILSGTVVCKLNRYTGMARLTQLTSETAGIHVEKGGNPIPTVTTINTMEGINTGKLITLNSLTCHVDGTTYTFTDEENRTVYPYSWGGLTSFRDCLSDGKTYDVTGIFCYGNNTNEKRINPRSGIEIMPTTPATLPFSWAGGGRTDLLATQGVGAYGLGTDYNSNDHNPYLVKFDNDGDFIIVRTDSQPDVVTIGVKKIGGSSNNSKITVQASTDGVNFDAGQDLAINGAQNATVTLTSTRSFEADVRYVKMLFTKGSNVGVGPISITKAKYAITLSQPGSGGTIEADKASADAGETVTLTPHANMHYALTSWTVCKTGDESTTVDVDNNQFVMPAYPVTVSATFTALQERTIIIPTEIEDNVDVTGNKAYAGDEVTIVIYAPTNKFLTSLTVTGYTTSNLITLSPEVSSDIDQYTFTMPDENVTITATFAGEYTVQFLVNGADAGSQTVAAGKSVTLSSPVPPTDFEFAGWTTNQTNFDNIITGNSYTPTADVTLYAVYSRTITGTTVTAYNKVSSISAGDYLIVCENSNVAFDGSLGTLDAVGNTISVNIENNTIASSASTDGAVFTISDVQGGYSIQSASGYYIGQTSDANGLLSNAETVYTNTISITDGDAEVSSGGAYLRYNSNSDQRRYRYFKSATYTSQKAIQLYKKETTTPSTTEYYTRIQSITGTTEITTVTPADLITVPSGAVLTITGPCTGGPENLIIEDGGQLITKSSGVNATVKKNVEGATNWGTGTSYDADGWYFIASPVDGASYSTAITTGSGEDYDLYMLDWAQNQWRNYKKSENSSLFAGGFQRGTGYLYASKEGNIISVAGEIKPLTAADTAKVILKTTGWNLIGNPLTCKVTVDCAFSELVNASAVTNKEANSVINPCQGIAVYGNAGTEVTFTKAATQDAVVPSNNNSLQMTLAKTITSRGDVSTKVVDNAVVSFKESKGMPKFNMIGSNTKLFIPQDDEEYSIVFSDRQGDVPLYFKANETGTYTISFAGDEMSLNGIYLIDILAEEEIDLSVNPSYTFIGSPADRMARFKIVFRNANDDGTSDIFAYQSGNDIIVSGEGELQIFDVMGRMVSRQYVSGVGTINAMPYGVYIFKLNGMTQKIVVR